MLVLILALVFGAIGSEDCSNSGDTLIHACISNSGTQVDIGASETNPGAGSPGRSPARPVPPEPTPSPTPDCNPVVGCRGGFEVFMLPEVTLADLASFRPASPTLTGEPAGFGIAGLPANVIAAASTQQVPGNLFGWDVVVRFVPAGYVFDYGDGASARVGTGGATWPQLGQAQFTPTATSHVYRSRGTYSVGATVQYAASVDFGSGWLPVTGYVTAAAGGYDVEILEARTALVDRTCRENPAGPGC